MQEQQQKRRRLGCVICRRLPCLSLLCVPLPSTCPDGTVLLPSREQETAFNNDEDITASQIKSQLKAAYYWAFALMYGLVGSHAQAGGAAGPFVSLPSLTAERCPCR